MAENQNLSKRKAPDDNEVGTPTKKRKNTETDIPYAESSKNPAKRKADEDINKEQPKRRPCPTCKGTDHSRSSSSRCKFQKRRASKSVQNENTKYQQCTVKIGLERFLKDQDLEPAIQSAVERMTRIVFEGSRLANQTALYHVALGDQFPFNTSEGAFKYVRQCFQAVTTSRDTPDTTKEPTINNIRDTLYTQYRPRGMNWTNKKSLGQLLSSAARQYITNCQNHITTNLDRRLKKWIKYKLFKIHQFPLPKKHINSIINHFITNLKNRDPPSLPSSIIDKLSTLHPQYLLYLTTRIQYIHSKVQQSLFQNQALDDASVKASWWSYLPGLHKILSTFTKHNRERGLRLFTLLPEYSFQQKYILVDTDALYYMYKSIEKVGITTIQRFRAERETWWTEAFNINKVTTNNRIFAYSIQTDGLAVSVNLQKKVDDDKEDAEEGSNIDLNGCKVFGLDPGRKDLFVAVGPNEKVASCSNKEYWNLAGFVRARKKRELWLEKNKYLQAVIRGELYFVNLICH